jgi:CPA2 family monovalent cation:H+ antiporter-2
MPLFYMVLPEFGAKLVGAFFMIVCISPFLRAIVMKKNHSIEFQALWQDNRFNRAPLLSTIVLRMIIAVGFILFIIKSLFEASTMLVIGIAIALVILMILSRQLKKRSIIMERTFMQNLNFRDTHDEFKGKKRPKYEGHLLSRDLHLSDFDIPADSLWAGYTLRELNLGNKYGVHVASIIRGLHRINIPGANVRLFPGDTIQVIGTDEQLAEFSKQVERVANAAEENEIEKREMHLRQFVIDGQSPFLNVTIKDSGIRNMFHCLVVGVEKEDGNLLSPEANMLLEAGDVVWVVGEKEDVYHLVNNES